MKAYSQDLRQRVLRAIDSGESQIETAEAFAVSVPTIKRYLRQRRETGHVLPKGIEGASCQKRSGVAGPLESAMRGPSRRDARRALLPVPSRTWHRREHSQHQSCQSGSGMDAKKTVRAKVTSQQRQSSELQVSRGRSSACGGNESA